MISLEKLKQIEPALVDIPDEQLLKIRRLLYQYAIFVLEEYLEKTTGSKNPLGSVDIDDLDV